MRFPFLASSVDSLFFLWDYPPEELRPDGWLVKAGLNMKEGASAARPGLRCKRCHSRIVGTTVRVHGRVRHGRQASVFRWMSLVAVKRKETGAGDFGG
jgi:hypothetical protein